MDPPLIKTIIKQITLDPEKILMEDRLFIFGRNPELSLAEIVALYRTLASSISIKDLTKEGVILHNNQSNSHISIKDCGSVLKLCKPIGIFPKPLDSNDILDTLVQSFSTIYLDNKVEWTLSVYNETKDTEFGYYDKIFEITKQVLKQIGIHKALFVKAESGRSLNPQRLQRKKIIEDGFELIIWHRSQDLVLAITEQVIDVDGMANRDEYRPHTRPLLLLGLALARSMVNLINIEKNNRALEIYDPFCGMGSIVQEAFLLGYSAFGSDIDPECVIQSQENLKWISETLNTEAFPSDHFFTMDLIKPYGNFIENFQGVIVSEPDLLTPLENYPHPNEAANIMAQFQANYNAYLLSFKQILPENGICVFIFPQLHTSDNRRFSLNLTVLLKKFGFQLCSISVNNISFPAMFVHAWKNPIIERVICVIKKEDEIKDSNCAE